MEQKRYNAPELLAPVGDMERLISAVRYGADAVYLAGKSFGMRSAPSNFMLMAQRMLEEQRKNDLLQQELRLAKPKADFYDAFIHPECCTNLRATAKELKVPEKMFTAFLIRKRYLYRAPSGTLLPYAKPASDGLFFVKDYIAVNGHQGVYTLVTPKGKTLFLSMLDEIA